MKEVMRHIASLVLSICLLGAGQTMAQQPMPEDYVIGTGDTLNIVVQDNPNLSLQGVSVRPDGKLTTPNVDDMVAAGKTTTQLARDMEAVLAKYLRTPQVTVILANAVSTFSQVKVIGAVKDPKALPYRKGLKVLDVLLAAGGVTEFANANGSKIVRTVDGKDQEIKVKIGNFNKGDLRQNFEMQPGDVLVVPPSRW